jgi:glycosyltransferase involved in cell wall biosynthesis
VLQFLPRLRAEGHTCVVSHSRPDKYEHSPWLGFRLSQKTRRLNRWLDVQRARFGRFDVVFIERELFHDPTWNMEERFRHVAKRIVLDVDDGIFLTYPEKFAKLAAMADCVIAGSHILAAKCREHSSHVVVVPTCVDCDRYPVKRHSDVPKPVIGWTGTSSNLRYLKMIEPALSLLAKRRPFDVAVIADEAARDNLPQIPGVNVRLLPWREETETADLLNFDIGVMPLPDEDWARYKCGLKLIQYMAAGLPTVASPVGVNPTIMRPNETGYLASTVDEWVEALDRLLADSRLRATFGQAGRQVAERDDSVSSNCDAWRIAVEDCRAGSRPSS